MSIHFAESKKFYSKLDDPDGFERDLISYLQSGYIYASPKCVILGKPVRRDGGSPDSQWWSDASKCDAWFVKFASGGDQISEFINAMPFQLPYVGWMRELKNRPVKYWRLGQVIRRS